MTEPPGPSGSGKGHIIKRCSTCGHQIYSYFRGTELIAVLKKTTLDDPNRFPPRAHIYVKNRLKWLELGSSIPKFEEHYDREETYSTESLERRRKVELR